MDSNARPDSRTALIRAILYSLTEKKLIIRPEAEKIALKMGLKAA
jgi:hypothetical protein